MAARAQFEQIRKALPPGMMPHQGQPGQQGEPDKPQDDNPGHGSGMYL
jgi:hypothetical protein